MAGKYYNAVELEQMTQEQLINKVMHFQNLSRQTMKKLNQNLELEQAAMRQGRKRKKDLIRKIDFKECNYRRIALKFAYLGWDYGGLQAQLNVDNTVEEILRNAIRRCKLAAEDDPLRFSRCGRTDKGVSAFQQVVTVRLRTRLTSGPGVTKWIDPFTLPIDDRQVEYMVHSDDESKSEAKIFPESSSNHAEVDCEMVCTEDGSSEASEEEFDFVQMLNRNLPAEIKVIAWCIVPSESFTARHDCLGREYRYYFTRGNLDVTLMNEAAQLFCGGHDFRNFGKLNIGSSLKFWRHIYEFIIEEVTSGGPSQPYDMCYARINGSGFVYHQVRNMMSVLYMIGAGLESPSIISELLDVETNPRKPNYGLTDAYPLVLYKSKYENLHWQVSDEARTLLLRHFHLYWNESATKATIVQELIKSIQREHDSVASDSNNAVHDLHTRYTLAGFKRNNKKPYRKIMDLPRGSTIEEKLESIEAKRKKLGRPETEQKVVTNQ